MLPGIGGKKSVKIIVWSGLLFLCLAARALATGVVGYLPMSDGEYAQKRALKPLLTLPYSVSPDQTWHFRQVGVSGVTLLPEPKKDNEWWISGKDRAGNSWVVPVGRLINLAGNAQFYRADLDRNGIQDLVIWLGNPGLGLAPSAQYIIFTFLKNGRPCVFEPWGFYTATDTGVDDLLDLQGNGRTQLLDIQFDSGYWITNLYQVKDARWQRVHGWFGRLSYPALTRFNHYPGRKLIIKPIAGRNPQTDDLSLTQRCLIRGNVLPGVNQD
ncbi:TPA: hypothetical protein M4R98_001338 [Salmonella enterica subsp. enterica serovar Paratyphi C]|nr:hypothetical protein [Salmonella enterica subsp. enterica serovar Paratyphi C]HCC1009061.1 hypothetical protein [Salmonella enterica subsp. enterica serovar Paratyphi C]HCC1029292.1 hypothetical protein [Salmonella enterica subsp. enterica serovar Paratyphi C]HCC1072921.1 hypothetical protein [Salmonella enterica subsp. enterica serovar Paratyphi C]HCC1086231.1 hypothetical protein [Salmonella enterica subsp. enterica serovar Paratyphi C]